MFIGQDDIYNVMVLNYVRALENENAKLKETIAKLNKKEEIEEKKDTYLIRHNIKSKHHIIYANYITNEPNRKRRVIYGNGNKTSISRFVKQHLDNIFPDIIHSRRGWNECEYKDKHGEWKPLEMIL
jgi:hypothetical protein